MKQARTGQSMSTSDVIHEVDAVNSGTSCGKRWTCGTSLNVQPCQGQSSDDGMVSVLALKAWRRSESRFEERAEMGTWKSGLNRFVIDCPMLRRGLGALLRRASWGRS